MTRTKWPVWVLPGSGILRFWGAVAYAVGSLFGRNHPLCRRDANNRLANLDEQLARGQMSIDQYAQQRRRLVDGH